MLKLMRKHQKFFYIFFIIIILSFIYWGVGTVDKTGKLEIVAEVGKYKITGEEYWETYERAYRFYREIFRDKFDEKMEKDLKEKVLDSLITEQVLFIAAKDAGIVLTDKELQESIMNDPAFMKNGVFDKQVYLNRLRLNRITPEQFENSKQKELIVLKMRHLIEESVDVPDIGSVPEQLSGDERSTKMLTDVLLNDRKERALRSYIEGIKKELKIKINRDLIS